MMRNCFAQWGGYLIASTFLSAGVIWAETILWDERMGDALSRGVLLSEAAFNDELIAQTCRRVAQEQRLRFLSLAILTHRGQQFDLAFGADFPMEVWIRNCRRAATSPLRVAVMVKIGDDAVVRIRDGVEVRRLVLTGRDPLLYRISQSDFEILHIALEPRATIPFIVLVRCTGILSLDGADDLYRQLQGKLPVQAIDMTIRKDSWFGEGRLVGSCWWGATAPPNKDAVWSAPEVNCLNRGSDRRPCTGRGL